MFSVLPFFGKLDGEKGERSGENGGDDGLESDVSCTGDIGRPPLANAGGEETGDRRGEEWFDVDGEIDGDEGPGVQCPAVPAWGP